VLEGGAPPAAEAVETGTAAVVDDVVDEVGEDVVDAVLAAGAGVSCVAAELPPPDEQLASRPDTTIAVIHLAR
jgi:hypothetical protein